MKMHKKLICDLVLLLREITKGKMHVHTAKFTKRRQILI